METKHSSHFLHEVTQEKIKKFCIAVGASDDSVAPPTYFTVCRHGEFELFQVLGISLSSVLHADQEYTYESEVRAGEVISFQTTLVSVMEKRGGALRFLTLETRFVSNRDQRQLGTAKSVVVIRSAGA